MLAARDANGNQVANPAKFPNGFKAVADFIHSLNMSSGLYTAKGNRTCAGFAASCQHEAQDALQWASWGIDYVKDDSCSECRANDDLNYGAMWQAIQGGWVDSRHRQVSTIYTVGKRSKVGGLIVVIGRSSTIYR
jgi:alpha-galactosidase